ncbi:hypothetical protein [Rubritalea sp.]|uniref:hypothetical protein n=1 Tax=Rubritalea sp. TaxID=2109375 RepID=UPI003EF2E1F1
MEPNLRDTPLRRFNTFWWGLALFAAFALSAVVVKNFVADDVVDYESELAKPRIDTKRKVDAEQAADLNTYKEVGDSKVQVEPKDVFGLGKQMGLLDGPKPSEMKHNRTFGQEPAAEEAPAQTEAAEVPATQEEPTAADQGAEETPAKQ